MLIHHCSLNIHKSASGAEWANSSVLESGQIHQWCWVGEFYKKLLSLWWFGEEYVAWEGAEGVFSFLTIPLSSTAETKAFLLSIVLRTKVLLLWTVHGFEGGRSHTLFYLLKSSEIDCGFKLFSHSAKPRVTCPPFSGLWLWFTNYNHYGFWIMATI